MIRSLDSKLRMTPGSAMIAVACLVASLWYPVQRFRPYFDGQIHVENDLGTFHLPMYLFISSALSSGDTSYWNPIYGCGFNLLGEGQVALLHPVRQWLFRVVDPELLLMIDVLAPTLIFQLGFYFFCRSLKISIPVSMTCSYFVAFSSSIYARHFHVNYLYVLAHLPWILICFRKYPSVRSRYGRVLLLIGIASLKSSQVLFGSPPYLFYSSILESTFLLAIAVSNASRRQSFELMVVYAASILIGFPQILATFEESSLSIRRTRAEMDYVSFGPTPLGFLNLFQAFNPFIVASSFPDSIYDGYERFVCSAGACLVICSLGIFRTSDSLTFRRWAVAMFLISFVLAFSTMLPPIQSIYDAIPLIGRFRIHQRYGCIAVTAIGLYLAMVMERYRRNELRIDPSVRWFGFPAWACLLLGSAVTPVFCAVAKLQIPLIPQTARQRMIGLATAFAPVRWQALGILFMAFAVLILVRLNADRSKKINAFCLLLIVQTFCLNSAFSRSRYESISNEVERFDPVLAKVSDSRVAFLEHLPNPDVRRLEITNPISSNTPFVNGNYALASRTLIQNQNDSLMRIAAARWIYERHVESGTTLVPNCDARNDGRIARQLENPLSRFRLVGNSLIAPDPDSELDRIDCRTTVVLPEGPEIRSYSEGELKVERILNGEKTFGVSTKDPQFLVLADTWHKGWKCDLNDESVPILKAYGRYQAVLIPPGDHVVRFRFEPEGLATGIRCSLAGAFILSLTILGVIARSPTIAAGDIPKF